MAWFKRKAKTDGARSDEIWAVCPSCNAHIFRTEWEKRLRVCATCNYHDRLTCRERVDLLIDAGTFREFGQDIGVNDPLKFSDNRGPYAEKARQAVEKTGLGEAVITGSGDIDGTRVVLAVMDFRFLGGSLGSGTGERILKGAEHALRFKRPYMVISASGGARMHEGILSLMQMAKTCAAIAKLQDAGLPYLSILTDPTTGGVSASYAMMGDLNLAEPAALIGFAGRRVIEQTIKQKLPKDFQTSEYLLEHGFVDRIVPRHEMKAFLASILPYLCA